MNSDKNKVIVRFVGDTSAEANLAAQRLSEFIQEESANIPGAPPAISQQKDHRETLDLGSTLVLVFGTPFAIAIAKGIAAYIGALGSRVVIETEDGKVLASGDAAHNIDVAKTVSALVGQKSGAANKEKASAGKSPAGAATSAKKAGATSSRKRVGK